MKIRNNQSPDLSQNLSSNTLFHFTKSFDKLASILKDGFKLSFVAEVLPRRSLKEKSLYYIAPMVCFCDIPLGGVKVHLQRYGSYGLGIHKTFCKHAKINPVFYIHNYRTFNYILPESILDPSSIVPYIKKYYGMNIRKKESFRFYNEREWRYVKSKKVEILDWNRDQILNRCDELNQNSPHYLSFDHTYVEYIIIKNKSEISKMVDFIDGHMKGTDQEKKILYTKIITATRIKYDF